LIYTTREIELFLLLAGQLACEALNFALKRLIKEDRPQLIRELGKGYGMPSSHSQFVGFWAVYVVLFLWLRLKPAGHGHGPGGRGQGHKRRVSGGVLKNGPPTPAGTALIAKAKETENETSVDMTGEHDEDTDVILPFARNFASPSTIYALQLRYLQLKNAFLSLAVMVLSGAVAYSRIYLSYHTPKQVMVGLLAGALFGIAYFGATSYLRSEGWIEWALELEIVRMARIRDLVCEEDLVELGWIVWEEKKRDRARRANGSSGGKKKTVRLIDPKTGNGAPPSMLEEIKKKR
jgi:dolichyldiphosphatase